MLAERIYEALDRAGLTPPVHYAAAPHEWREALETFVKQMLGSNIDSVKTKTLTLDLK